MFGEMFGEHVTIRNPLWQRVCRLFGEVLPPLLLRLFYSLFSRLLVGMEKMLYLCIGN
jgi:hypothetical protein